MNNCVTDLHNLKIKRNNLNKKIYKYMTTGEKIKSILDDLNMNAGEFANSTNF
jgi:hypothetical protein